MKYVLLGALGPESATRPGAPMPSWPSPDLSLPAFDDVAMRTAWKRA
jgi:hypothetical protein